MKRKGFWAVVLTASMVFAMLAGCGSASSKTSSSESTSASTSSGTKKIMAKLGADVEMFGCVGEDEAGAKLLKDLEETGVGTKWIRKIRGVPTGFAMITAGEGDNTIVVVAGANDSVTPEYIDSVRENLLEADIVILQHALLDTASIEALIRKR